MSRSKRKPIYKDKGWEHDIYNKRIRRIQKQVIKDIINLRNMEDYNIPLDREIVNDYDISDYRFDYRFYEDVNNECIKLTRK